MSWEWRVFLPASVAPDLSHLLIGGDAEERDDSYLALTDGFGYKLRNGTKPELKIRDGRPTNDCEQWSKISLLNQAELTRHLDPEAAQAATREIWVTLDKTIRWASIKAPPTDESNSPGSNEVLLFEQTEIAVEVEGRQSSQQWRSFSVEGPGGPDSLLRFVAATPELRDAVSAAWLNEDGCVLGGYPSFVVYLTRVESQLAAAVATASATGLASRDAAGGAGEGALTTTGSRFKAVGQGKGGFKKLAAGNQSQLEAQGQGRLWLLRHGERVDETADWVSWAEETPSFRHFDPPLTQAGEAQARDAARAMLVKVGENTGHKDVGALSSPSIFQVIYSSPLERALSTAHEAAQVLGTSEVRVVYGLAQCAAAVRKQGPDYRERLQFLNLEAMRTICPEVSSTMFLCWRRL